MQIRAKVLLPADDSSELGCSFFALRLVGLETRPELNNASGVVVAVQASRP